jgi:hypothetical protein
MNFKRMTACAAALACGATLGVTSMASADAAHGTFANALPIANGLCTHVRAGKEAKRLQPFATQIIADCTTAETEYTAARSTAVAGQAAVRAAALLDKAAFKTACPKFTTAHATCVTAKHTIQAEFRKLSIQRFNVDLTYLKTVESIRVKFWTAIHSLPGAKHVKTDAKIKP